MGRIKGAVKVSFGHPSEPSEELLRLFAYGESTSGVAVTETTALGCAPYWSCTRVIAEDVASLPLPVYRKLIPRGKVRAPEHPLYRLLHDEPNPEMQAMDFREAVTSHAVTWGNGYAEIERTNAGTIKALWPLRPDRMRLERRDGQLYYLYTVGGVTYALLPRQVLHIHGLGFDGVVGYSVARVGANSIGIGMALDEYAGRLFSNGAAPRGVIEQPDNGKKLGDESIKRLRTNWDETYGGLSNVHRVAVLEEGLTYKAVGLPPNDTQMLESRQYQAVEVCRWFRMQPHKIGILDRATWANIEQQNIEHGTDTIRPWCVRWEQAVTARLLTEAERRDYVAEHLIDAIMRGDAKSRGEAHSLGIQSGYLCPNDVAEMENRNPIEGGDQYFIPLNLVPLAQAGQPREVEPKAPDMDGLRRDRLALGLSRLRKAYAPAIAAGFRNLAAEERRAVMTGPATLADTDDPAVEVEAALQTTYGELTKRVRAHVVGPAVSYGEAVEDLARQCGVAGSDSPLVGLKVELNAAEHGSLYLNDGLDTLLATLSESVGLGATFDRWQHEGRSARYVAPLMDDIEALMIPAGLLPAKEDE
jgi:HK97 family phage portal protein